ncbi:MAG: ATP-dependent DNA ligase [Candidatus Korobacteraceae bacterium]
MKQLAQLAEAISQTRRKSEKVALVADYLRSRTPEEAAVSAVFLSGRPFPSREEATLQVGGAVLWSQVADLSGADDSAMAAAYRRHGDLGSATYELLESHAPAESTLTVLQVEACFREIAGARGSSSRAELVHDLLARATALEAKYLVKIMTGELRIGLKESLVEEAIAKAYGALLPQVQRANMLLGDIGETVRLAVAQKLADARMRMFHPIGFMLASPAETAEEAFQYFQHAQVEDKYDGIRAQAHVAEGRVRLFSRTLDEITDSFPELRSPLAAFHEPVILDGEIVAWRNGRALPFSELQKRLGRKKVSPQLLAEVPVALVAFDLLYAGGDLVIDHPLRQRMQILDRLFADVMAAPAATGGAHAVMLPARDPQGDLALEPAIQDEQQGYATEVIRAPVLTAESPEQLAEMFDAAQARGNEGLMIKDLESVYGPGRRGRSWLKLKRELATLDVVVTSVEYGHGKRAGVLSDYTFSVWDKDRLVTVGKAYSGLTDAEIAEMTRWFLEHTIADHGFRREVEPTVVLEVAFNAVMQSDRHESGYALRFPRILRLRPDKPASEADTLDRVRSVFQLQHQAPKKVRNPA